MIPYRLLMQRARTINTWTARFLDGPAITDRSILRELREARDTLNKVIERGEEDE
jgi:hypothetical protein